MIFRFPKLFNRKDVKNEKIKLLGSTNRRVNHSYPIARICHINVSTIARLVILDGLAGGLAS